MKPVKCLLVIVVLAMLGATAPAGGHRVRQYYSGWQRHSHYGYYYRHYYYKPYTDYYGYRHHYVIYFPQRPDHCYFYNPYAKRYWGRCPVKHDGKAAYALLKESDRRETLADIPESAFPKPGAMPAVPESTDGEAMDLPPDDLPQMEPAAK